MKKSGATRIVFTGHYLLCNTRDLAKLANIQGIDSVTKAKQASSHFADLMNTITELGVKAILPGERFYVKVILTVKTDYVERDVEFASAGALVERLAKINALPARSEHEVDRVILAVVGKKWAHVCIRDRT